jgi:hypothetical protein
MDSEYLGGGFSRQKELEKLEERLMLLKEELIDMNDTAHGRSRATIKEEIAEVEARIKLHNIPTGEQ